MIETQLLFRNDVPTPLGRLTMAGFLRDSGGVVVPRTLGSYALVYVLEGSGHYGDGHGRSYRVRPGDMILIFPTISHTYGPGPGEYWNEFYCVFDGPVFDLWQQVGLLNPAHPVQQLTPVSRWLALLQAAVPRSSAHTMAERVLELSRFLHALTEILTSSASEPPAEGTPPWIARACALLEADLERPCDLEQIAAAVGLPYETFRKRFQQWVGVAPGRYRSIRRIDAACSMLQEPGMPVQTIAAHLGFADVFHFSRRFKQVTGLSPSEFRRRLPTTNEQRVGGRD